MERMLCRSVLHLNGPTPPSGYSFPVKAELASPPRNRNVQIERRVKEEHLSPPPMCVKEERLSPPRRLIPLPLCRPAANQSKP